MYKKILVPVTLDHEPNINAALEAARVMSDEGGEITLLHVMEEIPGFIATQIPEGTIDRNIADTRAQLAAIAKSAGGNIKSAVVIGHASRGILDFCEEQGSDCIIITSHRPGLQDYLLGSTAARVVRHANCSVHVIR